MIRLATAEQELNDVRSDRDRLQAKIDDLTAGDGALARMTADVETRDVEISRLTVRVADLEARIDASEDAATRAIADRDDAMTALGRAQRSLEEAEQAKLDSDLAVDVARSRIAELESTAETRVTAADDRAHAAERALEQLRRDAAEATEGRRVAEGELARTASERDELRARLAAVDHAPRGGRPARDLRAGGDVRTGARGDDRRRPECGRVRAHAVADARRRPARRPRCPFANRRRRSCVARATVRPRPPSPMPGPRPPLLQRRPR